MPERRMVTARGWGTGRVELVLSGYGVAVWEKEKSSRDGWWGRLQNNVNVLNATELYSSNG